HSHTRPGGVIMVPIRLLRGYGGRIMPSMTVKGMSDALLAALRARAAANRRSVNQEIIVVLEGAVASPAPTAGEWSDFRARADALRERLRGQYGTQSDSAELIREARDER